MSNNQKKTTDFKVFDGQGSEMLAVRKLYQDGNDLVMKGKILGAMPLNARLRPEEARAAIKQLDFKTILFLLTILFRPSSAKAEE